MSDPHRLVRLVGDGDTSGGGLPLPDAFTAVLQELLDHGPATASLLNELMIDTLSYKTKRIMSTWKAWPDFTADIIDQLAEAGMIQESAGKMGDPEKKWELTGKFTPGIRQVIIPKANIGVTVRRHAERVRVNALSRVLADARALESRLVQMNDDSTAVQGVRMHMRKAVLMLEAALDGNDPLRAVRERRSPQRGPQPRPTSRELAKDRYGLGGEVPATRTNTFGPDGTRRCVRCSQFRTPEEFQVYWESGHNHAYFLRGACIYCERDRTSARKNK